MCRFFWSRDLFISQGHGLYIKYVNHDLTVMMLNILKCSYPYAKAVVVILYERESCYIQQYLRSFSYYALGVCHTYFIGCCIFYGIWYYRNK